MGLTFEEFKSQYRKDRNTALFFARQLGITLAQCQLWVLRIVNEGL